MPNKLEKLKAIIELMQNDTITPKQVKEFLDHVLQSIVTARKDIEELSDEHLKLIKEAVYYIESKKKETLSDIESSKKSIKEDFESNLRDANDFLEEVKRIKVTKGDNGKDGKDGAKGKDGKNGKDGKDGSPDTPEEIKDKLETLEGENRLDASAIKNLPEFIKDDKRIGFGSMIREAPKDGKYYARKDRKWEEVQTGGGGGTWGSITGTLSNQTDLQSALNAKQNSLGYIAENTANKSTSVTTDQASDTKYPSVKAVFDWASGAFTTTAAVASQITTALSGYATQAWVTSQGYITNVVTALGFTPENVANKSDSYTASSSTTYASTKALVDGLATKQNALLIATATASNSAVIDFTLPTGYDYFELFVNYLVPQTDATSFLMRASIDGGATFLAGASDYTAHRTNLTGGGGTTYAPSYGSAAQIASIGNLVGNASSDYFRGSFRIFNPNTSGKNKYITGETSMMRSDNQPSLISFNAVVNNTSAVNAIRLLMSSGNITSGEFSLYGYK